MASLMLMGSCLTAVVTAQYGAIQALEGLSPRYYLGGSQQLEERQDGVCPFANMHTCLDINATKCCYNTEYCINDTNFTAACCAIGSNCGFSLCGFSQYICPTSVTVSGTPTVSATCCNRSCPSTSAYKCEASLGGGCCNYDSSCTLSGGQSQCVSTPSSTQQPLVTENPSGCTTSQIACASSLGGGCCANTESCLVFNNTNWCASATTSAVRTGSNGIYETAAPASGGLSSGAKAGIGAGVAGGALAVFGALLWFCIVHRRNARPKPESAQAMSQGSGSEAKRPSAGRQASDYFGPSAAAGPFTEDHSPHPATSPGTNRGVPATPHSPGDIVVPVEIDSRGHSNVTTPGNFEFVKSPEAIEYPVELP